MPGHEMLLDFGVILVVGESRGMNSCLIWGMILVVGECRGMNCCLIWT